MKKNCLRIVLVSFALVGLSLLGVVAPDRTTGIVIDALGFIPFAMPASAQERIDLTAQETKPANSQYTTERIVLDQKAGVLSIFLTGQNNESVSCMYTPTTTPTGATLMIGLNKANLSTAYAGNATTGSLSQRVFHRLVIMGESTAVCGKTLTGTIAGSVP